MRGALLEIFLEYCKRGIRVESKELCCFNVNFKEIEYKILDEDFIIYDERNSIVIPCINKNWIVEEYNTYIKLYNKNSTIYIREA